MFKPVFISCFIFVTACLPLFGQVRYWPMPERSPYLLEFVSFQGMDSVEHFILRYSDGTPGTEYYYKNGFYLDTLKHWFSDGTLANLEIFSDSGYTEITYDWNLREEGQYRRIMAPPAERVLDDSATWIRYSVYLDAYKKPPYYVRTGAWKTFYASGTLHSQGSYLPEQFYSLCPDESRIIKKGFEMEDWCFRTGKPYEGLCAGCTGHLKDGEWIYYDLEGQETHREYYRDGICISWK